MSSESASHLTLEELMTRQVVTVAMDDSLETVREDFHRCRFHHLLVVDSHKVVGVLSDRDLLRHLSPFAGKPLSERAQDEATLHKHVHQIMTRRPITARADMLATVAARLMLDQHISCLPVVDEESRPVGIVTWRDLLRGLVEAEQGANIRAA
jgi:acetoin utilization protein AcuB